MEKEVEVMVAWRIKGLFFGGGAAKIEKSRVNKNNAVLDAGKYEFGTS